MNQITNWFIWNLKGNCASQLEIHSTNAVCVMLGKACKSHILLFLLREKVLPPYKSHKESAESDGSAHITLMSLNLQLTWIQLSINSSITAMKEQEGHFSIYASWYTDHTTSSYFYPRKKKKNSNPTAPNIQLTETSSTSHASGSLHYHTSSTGASN